MPLSAWLLACVRPHETAAEPPIADLAPLAIDYVHLVLGIGEQEPGYVDAYYGPPEWRTEEEAAHRSVEALETDAIALLAALDAIDPARLAPLDRRRRAFLAAHVRAARFRLDTMGGVEPSFADEAEALFDVRPDPPPLSDYDPVLARIDSLLPGDGPLVDRVERFESRYEVPADRVEAVVRAAIDECRARTLRHLSLPAGESFRLELVTGQPWSGYNWYQGHATSLIQVNTNLAFRVGRAVDLGCHEGYPGHHVHNALLESALVDERGWVELTVYPLYSPLSLIAEGEANFGIALAFPGDDQLAFERDVLYPLAGLDPATAAPYDALRRARRTLSSARVRIAMDYLDHRIDRSTAADLTGRYLLVSPERAQQALTFADTYRSYVVNYTLGEELVGAAVKRAPADEDGQWAAFRAILTEPTLPEELAD